MSLLDESLARSLELVKREAETPLEQSLRAEVAGLTERLKVLEQEYTAWLKKEKQISDRPNGV